MSVAYEDGVAGSAWLRGHRSSRVPLRHNLGTALTLWGRGGITEGTCGRDTSEMCRCEKERAEQAQGLGLRGQNSQQEQWFGEKQRMAEDFSLFSEHDSQLLQKAAKRLYAVLCLVGKAQPGQPLSPAPVCYVVGISETEPYDGCLWDSGTCALCFLRLVLPPAIFFWEALRLSPASSLSWK